MSTEAEAEEEAQRAFAERQWPVVVTLSRPVDFAGETISKLEFRRGRLGDLKGVPIDGTPPLDKVLLIASRMCGKPVAALEMISEEDAAEVIVLALGFFGRCLGGGKTR